MSQPASEYPNDAQLPPALVRLLASLGHQAQHVGEIGLRDATDQTIWDFALSATMVIFTKDEDFALRRIREATGPPIVWLRVGNSSTGELAKWLMPLLQRIEHLIAAGESLIEVR